MTARTSLLLLLAAAGCAGGRPVPSELPADLPPLPRSSIVAVLAHRSELELTDEQAARLEQADAELQARLARLRAEGGQPPAPAGGAQRSAEPGPPGGEPGGPGMAGGGRQGPGFGMNMGPGGFQLTPGAAPVGGSRGEGPRGGGAHAKPRRDLAKEQEALEARLDDADTAAFLKAEQALSAGQRERAREIATTYREQLFERREALRGR